MVISETEIKKNILHSILDFSVDIDTHRKSGNYTPNQVTEMLSLAIEINNLINLLDKDHSRTNPKLKKPDLGPTESLKLKRVLDLIFKYHSDINSVAIDIGENLSSTNRYLKKGIDYLLTNLKESDFLMASAVDPRAEPKKVKTQQKQVRKTKNKKPAIGVFSSFLFLAVLVAIALFIYNTFFDTHATRVTSLVKEYRSDRKLSSVSRPNISNELKVYGTKSLLNIAIDLKGEFKARFPKLEASIEGGDSGIAIRDLIDGNIDLAAVSRIPNIQERRRAAKSGRQLADHKMALDSVIFFVHPSNPLETISIDELKKIFKAEEITWREASLSNRSDQKLDRFSLSKQSGTYAYFKERVMYGETTSEQVIHIYTPGQMLDMVAANPNALGFCSVTVLKNKNFSSRDKVKVLKITSIFDEKGSKPIRDDKSLDVDLVKRGEYPLTRYLYLITAGDLTDSQAKFIDFMRSEDAQAKLGEFGLVGIN